MAAHTRSVQKENSNAPLLITGVHRQRYQILLSNVGQAHPAATPVDSHCLEAISRFIRHELGSSDVFWRGMLRQYFPECLSSDSKSLHRKVAELTQKQRIRFYKLPGLKKAMVAKDGKGKAYRFVRGPDPLPSEELKPVNFSTPDIIENTMAKTSADDGFWASVLEESGTMPRGKYVAPGGHKSLVVEKLASGELRAYELPYTPAAPKSVMELVSEEPSAGAKPVPLAPETPPGWIELKLLYDDDEPIANEKYWIRDKDGNEYTGTTDEQGMARVKDVTDGYCEIKFPELDGWYQ
ncbi:MAG: hypothetical protein K6L80_03015 [Agarilytica sp.]